MRVMGISLRVRDSFGRGDLCVRRVVGILGIEKLSVSVGPLVNTEDDYMGRPGTFLSLSNRHDARVSF